MKQFIITPTYNEKENLPVLVREVRKYLPEVYILVVDDNSPDGTGQIADRIAEKDPRVMVLHRDTKNGFGKAYTDGLKFLFNRFSDIITIAWMDADLSHNPKYLPDFFELLKSCDVVVGSRYINGGGVWNWPLRRKILSRGGNSYTRTVSGLKTHDCTSGFIAFRADVLRTIPMQAFHAAGYSFLIETKLCCQKMGFKIKEFPIIFEERRQGVSKLNRRIIAEALLLVWKLRFAKYPAIYNPQGAK